MHGTKLFVCKICTDPFIVGINTATVQKLFADYTAMPPVTHGDKLSDKTNNGLDLETCSRVRISS